MVHSAKDSETRILYSWGRLGFVESSHIEYGTTGTLYVIVDKTCQIERDRLFLAQTVEDFAELNAVDDSGVESVSVFKLEVVTVHNDERLVVVRVSDGVVSDELFLFLGEQVLPYKHHTDIS
ncbi:hypothetical protein OGAPHI_006764 [Ogataea philodendri]|uniref:Uncharacterized protein n=1 Tax=Ogataea philodendri TaxID=1378263 RepID=A0A9P8NXP7_9ASCO|nr:uncharacterized protein OGAPHI_006764 [Ogataea philodendri]KAH3661357.1 hypothetical protein OGAPHI_006764 [Ogataea philodendri]